MTAAPTSSSVSQLDVVFDGTWVIVPSVNAAGNITGVDIYSPSCGHPHGVIFTNALNPNPWPSLTDFYMLDPHSHTLVVQRPSGTAGMPLSGINRNINHCIVPQRYMGGNWDLMFSILAGPDMWTSSETMLPQTIDSNGNTVNCLSGADAPPGQISQLQTLSFLNVTAVQLLGAPIKAQTMLPSQWNGVGSLIVEGEIPYIPTITHERSAFAAMAALAGIDLEMDFPLPPKPAPPSQSTPQPMFHAGVDCAYSLLVLPY